MTASIEDARTILERFGFAKAQTNDRAGLVLLALLGLKPGDSWSSAINPMLTTFEIMQRIREDWGKDYAPNSRETIRRFTLHQFNDAGLTEYNADYPERPVNSALNNYRVSNEALDVIRAWDTPRADDLLAAYLLARPGQLAAASAAREMLRIPVTLPDGSEASLSPGGQNVLIALIMQEFCPRFTPGGQVLYLGDADSKLATYDVETFKSLQVVIDEHGKMPDVVVWMPDKNWLVLMEAASTHGPVDAKRHAELRKLFDGTTAGLVYVSCFPDRATMRRYLADLAWETEAWCADSPDHMIHFNGERFLGPYTS